jgi:hypothetical protein
MKACGEEKVQLYSFLTTVLRRLASSQHYARPPYSEDRVPGTQGLRYFWVNYENKFGNVTYT